MLNRFRLLKLIFISTTFLFAFFALNASAQSVHSVSGVEVAGNQRIDTDAIKLQIKHKSGQITSDEVTEDVKTLYKTGYFDQVNASISTHDGRSYLLYSFVEKPLVRKVFVKGNEAIGESDIAEVVKFGDKRFLDKAKIDALKRSIISYYESRGYNEASVDHAVVPVGDNQVDLTFTVSEGKRFKLRTVVFKGLNKIDDSDLISLIETRRYKWYSSWLFGTGRINKDQLEADRGKIRQYFLDNGYIEGTISDPIIEQDAVTGNMTLTFEVNEGKQYKVGRVAASGDLVDNSAEKTIEGIASKTGEVFSASKIREDSFLVSEKFTDKGYAFANVASNTNVNQEASTVDLDFASSKGKVVSVNRINVKGNEKTYDNVIRRELKIQEQDTFSSSKIKRSQALLQRLGYFDEVNISNAAVPGIDDAVDLDVNVREARSTGSFSIGAGYSTSDGAIATARLTENNIFGTGRKFDINADVGTERNNVSASVTDRRFNDSMLALSIEALRSERLFDDFDRVMTGGAVSAGYPLEEVFGETFNDIQAALRYELLQVQINDVDELAATFIKNSEGDSVSSAITPSLTRNTINNPLNPRTGSNQVLSYEVSGLGGDQDYTLAEAKNTFYLPLFDSFIGEFIFSNRTRFSYGESNSDDPFPLFKRFFPGGINSIRGFENRSLGPREGDSEYGGAKQFINNAELLFPLVESAGIKGVLFYDIGNAFNDEENVEFSEMRKSWGVGLRWLSPLGPLRLEFGFPIARKEGEDKSVPMFSFGVPF